jgi:hypothetical protein
VFSVLTFDRTMGASAHPQRQGAMGVAAIRSAVLFHLHRD